MASTGLLIISNIKNIAKVLSSIGDHVKSVLYVDLNLLPKKSPPQWSRTITDIYLHSMQKCPTVDVRVLVTSLKADVHRKLSKNIDVLLFDQNTPGGVEKIQNLYKIKKPPTYLSQDFLEPEPIDNINSQKSTTMYDNVALGGTFDRIHLGHKILLNEAILRARKRIIVGVTAPNMLASKKLSELILPLETRIRDVREFMEDVDNTLHYEIVPITDALGPTRTDPNLDLLIVSPETVKGGLKVNEVRSGTGLKPLEIFSIDLIEVDLHDQDKELKVSSSNYRMDLLGTRLHDPKPRPNLPESPYIIGLTGGIASGKSVMAGRFEKRGAKIINCDLIAHQVYEPGKECYKKIVKHFGDKILGDDSFINRKILGEIVFSDPSNLEELNEIVWPEILVEVRRLISQYTVEKCKVVIVEAAILMKAGWDQECHEIWSMIIPPEEAIQRIMKRNSLNEEEARKRISSQLSNFCIVDRSNVVFSSLWSMEFTQRQADRAWDMLSVELKL